MTWLSDTTSFRSHLETVPALAQAHGALYESFAEQSAVPPATLELCRLRLARLHDTLALWLPPLADIDTDKHAALTQWASHPDFAEHERACLDFAEVYAMDPQGLSDDQAERVKACLGERGLVVLIEALGVLDGALRLGLLWQLDAEGGAA